MLNTCRECCSFLARPTTTLEYLYTPHAVACATLFDWMRRRIAYRWRLAGVARRRLYAVIDGYSSKRRTVSERNYGNPRDDDYDDNGYVMLVFLYAVASRWPPAMHTAENFEALLHVIYSHVAELEEVAYTAICPDGDARLLRVLNESNTFIVSLLTNEDGCFDAAVRELVFA